jgi:hypothetical protein
MAIHDCIEMGGVAVQVQGDNRNWYYPPGHGHRFFATTRTPDIVIQVSRLEPRHVPVERSLLAESHEPGGWRLYAAGGAYAIHDRAFAPSPPTLFERWTLLDAGFSQGGVLLPEAAFHAERLFPLQYHLDLLLVASFLARQGGMLLHATAIRDDGQGFVFSGPSGAGKSTLAGLWRVDGRAQVLNHDLVALRRGPDGGLAVYGTPWWTEDPALCSPLGAPLRAIYFIEHGTSNRITPLRGSEAAVSLVAQSYTLAHCDAGLAADLLDLCVQVAETVPIYRLEFRPDAEVLALIRASWDERPGL